MSYQSYLKNTMYGLSTMIYNASQHPNEKTCNEMIDSLKRTIQYYNEESGEMIDITDHRK